MRKSFITGWFFVLAVFLVSSCVPGEENQVIIQPALTEEQITQIVNNKINQEIPKITDVCRNSVPVYIRDVANEGFLEEVKSYLTREGGKKLDMKTRTELDACKGSSERDICFFFTEIGKTPYNKIIKTIQKMANDVRPQVPLAKFAEFRPCDYPRGDMVFASVEAKPIVREKEKVAVDITLSLSEVSEETIIWLRFARGKGGFLDNLVREDDKRFSSGIEVGSGKKWTTSITGEVDKGELDGENRIFMMVARETYHETKDEPPRRKSLRLITYREFDVVREGEFVGVSMALKDSNAQPACPPQRVDDDVAGYFKDMIQRPFSDGGLKGLGWGKCVEGGVNRQLQ